jgi:predicted ArsR family transcriptional regulator
MHDTRRQVLETIKRQGQATVAGLAEALGISPISIRHHLTGLQADGLVGVALERQAVGRPRHIYSLTEAGEGQFGAGYRQLAERLLNELRAALAPEQVSAIIDRIAAGIAVKFNRVTGSIEERLRQLVYVLGEEGFRAAVRRIDATRLLTEVNCPYVYVGPHHPDVCHIDDTVIRLALRPLEPDVQRTSCVLDGDRVCTFSIEQKA